MFKEADRRDPSHAHIWVALVDGNNHQIQRIQSEAKARGVKVTIVVDFIHVLDRLCLHCPLTFLRSSLGLARFAVSACLQDVRMVVGVVGGWA